MAPPVASLPKDGNSDTGSISAQAPSPATNGPVHSDSSDEIKVWERPWTIPEIKAAAGNWSLAGDAGLLLHLQDFSQRILSKTHDIEKQVDNLVHEATMTGVRVNNVFNDFIMLANSQFVENRVYDEDISQKENHPQEKKTEEISKEQKEAELLTMVVQAVNFGLDVIDHAFEKLDTNVGNSDSEDEENSYGVGPLFEAKDPYLQRPLPYLIGSSNFMQDDNVGLLEIFSEEDEGETDHGSLSDDSEPEKGKLDQNQSEYTDEDFSSDDDDFLNQKTSRTTQQSKYNNDEESDEDLFGSKQSENEDDNYYSEKSEGETSKTEESDAESDEKGNTPEKPQTLSGFQAELSAKLGVPPMESTAAPEKTSKKTERKESVSSVKSSKNKKKPENKPKNSHPSKESILPFGAPEEEENENSPFGRTGIFSNSKKSLFDDDNEEEGGLFGSLPRKASVKQSTTVKQTESDQYDDLFAAPVENVSRKKSLQDDKKKPAKMQTLFDDDDEEDDLFSSSASANKQVTSNSSAKSKPVVSLFDDDDDEEEEDLFAQYSRKKENISKVEKREEDDKADLSDGDKSLNGSIKSITSSSSTNRLLETNKLREGRSSSQSSNSLFADEPDSDILFTKPSSSISQARAKVAGLDLFDDDEEDEADPFSKSKTKTNNTDGSVDSGKDNQEKKSPASGLFSDGEDDLFSSAKPKESVKKKPVGGVSLFGDIDIFAKKKNVPEKEEPKKADPTKPSPRQSTLSLFDDDEEDENADALFSPLSKPAAGVTPTAPKPELQIKQRTKSVFDDEDVLFGAPEENPSVDLFSSEGPLASKKKKSPVPAPTTSKSADTATDLFGDSATKTSEPKKTESDQATTATSRTLNIEGVTGDESADADVSKETKPVAAPPVVKKPIGGVSLFGGVDPFAEMMKKKKAAEADKEENENESPVATSAEKSGEQNETPPVKESIPPPKARKPLRVESEQHDLANQLQIPRPQPPTSFGTDKLESPGVSFDHPPTPQPLHSATVTKERARITSRRRPQSRRARLAAAGAEFDSTDFSPISPMTAAPYLTDEGTFSPINPIDAMSAPVLYSDKDPFNYKEILNSKTKPSALSTPTQENTPPKVSASSDSKDSISKEHKNNKAAVTTADPPPLEDDLFADVAKKMPSKTVDTDDLFGPSSVPSDSKKTKDVVTSKKKVDTNASKTEKTTLPKNKTAKNDARDNDDDDDIFADAAITVSKKKDAKLVAKPDDDEDDIFASSSVSTKALGADPKDGSLKTTSKKPRNNVSKDDDLFADDTDIFADLPTTKQKEKKTPTTTKSASKPLFQGDIDDIFADSLPSKKKESTLKTENGAVKKSEKPISNKVTSIFDDDDDDASLFDDPLSVKNK